MTEIAQNLFLGIGIDKYTHKSWRELYNPVNDVDTLGNILCQKYGFEQMRGYLTDARATRQEIHELLTSAIGCSEYDNLVIYFAGHGQMWPNDKGNWVPHDGTDQNYSWISGSTILDHLSLVMAKHILIIHDCCFSGAFTIGQPKLSLLNLSDEELEEKTSRIIFTSGEVKKVSDGVPGEGSPFSQSLCEYLENYAKQSLRVSKLIDAVTRTTVSRSNQKPLSSEINNSHNENGEMILRLVKSLGGGDSEDEPIEFPLPAPAEGLLEIPRTVTAKENQQSIAQLMFDLETYRIALEDVLRKEKRIILLGAAGAGKSHQMIETARKVKSIGEAIPIFKRLNGFEGINIYNFLEIDPGRSDLEQLILFLDGLDEVSPDCFLKVVNAINALGEKHPLLGIVVSCRTNFYDVPQEDVQGSLNGFSVYYLNDIQAKDILEHASDKVEVDAEEFLQKTHFNGLSELVHNPFFLNLLFQHFIDHSNLDVDRAKLMELAVERAIGNNPNNYGILERMAFVMETIGRNFLTDEQMQDLKLEDLEWEGLEHARIFYRDDDQEQWRFEHNNIQEYLAARVLSKLSFEELIAIIYFEVGGQKKIRPTWLNTVAFFSSVGNQEIFDQLFNWILQNDNEVVIRLEPHRLTEDQRFLAFKGVFEFYAQKGVWLRSNLFNTMELARFSRLNKTIDYLIGILTDKHTSRITKLNAIHVLFAFDMDGFDSYKSVMLKVLVAIIQENFFEAEDTISVLGLIAQLRLADRDTADFLIQKYSHSRNAYLRAGIYQIIAEYDLMDDYIVLLLDGLALDEMKYGDNDRTDDNLIDESYNLRRAIEKISTSFGLQKFIEGILGSRTRRYTLTRDHRELLPKLVNNAISNFISGNGEMYDLMLKLYISIFEDFDEHLLQELGEFFKSTNTLKDLLLYVWLKIDKERLGWDKLTLGVLGQDLVNHFIALCKSKDLDVALLRQFHCLLFYQRHRHVMLLEQLEDLSKKELDVVLERPTLTDWQAIEMIRAQRDFNLLFDKNEMFAELKHAFEKAETEELSREGLYSLMSENYGEIKKEIAQSSLDLLRDFTDYGRSITLEDILNWVENSELYPKFNINKIKTRLSNNQYLEVDEGQKNIISDWCLNVGDDLELLWFFLHKLGIELREDQLLALTKHPNSSVDGLVDQPGSLEMLEAFLDSSKLKSQVLENLEVSDLSIQGWISNIAYCLRKGIEEGFVYLVNTLAARQQEGYKDKELLEFWFKNYPDLEGMRKIITESDALEIKWKAISLLKTEAGQRNFLVETLGAIMNNELQPLPNRKQAANLLIELGELSGFDFLANLILETKDPTLDFRWGFRNIGMINSVKALEKLIDLLYLAKKTEFKNDIFNDLESIVLNALVNVGLESEENSGLVISSLEAFIEKYANELPHLNFLYFTIARIRDGFAFKKTTTFEEALTLYDNLKFS